jgi:hypothetical protein
VTPLAFFARRVKSLPWASLTNLRFLIVRGPDAQGARQMSRVLRQLVMDELDRRQDRQKSA